MFTRLGSYIQSLANFNFSPSDCGIARAPAQETAQQQRTCKIMQDCARILHARLAWHVHTICPFSCTFLAHILQEMVQDFARAAARIISTSISCTFFFPRSCKNWCKIVQETCKKRDISCARARAKQVLHARFLHDFASSFLLGVHCCYFYLTRV